MKLKNYLNELGKFPEKIERKAYLRDHPAMLTWTLVNPSTNDQKRNYKTIEDIAWKELQRLKKTKTVDFYDNAFDISSYSGIGAEAPDSYEASVKLTSYDVLTLMKKLRQFKFKVK